MRASFSLHFAGPAFLFYALMTAATAGDAQEPAAEPSITAADFRADLGDLYRGLQASHYDLYARRPRADYDALFAKMQSAATPVSLTEAQIQLQRFAAFGNVAHARIEPPDQAWDSFRKASGKAFPTSVQVVSGKVFVSEDYSGVEGIAPGDQLVSIEGQPALDWLARMRANLSADNDYLAYTMLESRLPMLVWMERGEQPSFPITVLKADGRRVDVVLPARSRAEVAAATAARPKTFELDWNAREARVLDHKLAYLRPGPFYDNRPEATDLWDFHAFTSFIDRSFEQFNAAGATRLLIDLRDNPGGDNSFSDPMLAWFASKPFRFSSSFRIKVSAAAVESNRKRLSSEDTGSTSAQLAAAYAGKAPGSFVEFPIPLVNPRKAPRYKGRVFILINRHSYSNTVLVAATAQDYGFATILGEETADLASTIGAMETFTLPITGITVGFPKARILRPSGDPQARGVIPDIAIATPLIAGQEDLVLKQAMKIATESR